MDLEKAKEAVKAKVEGIHQTLEHQLGVIYGTPGFDADGMTDHYGSELLTTSPESPKSHLQQWAERLESLAEGKRYAVDVRVTAEDVLEYGGLVSKVVGKQLRHAWIYVYEDLTPAAFTFNQGFEDDMVGGEPIVKPQSIARIDHPFTLFTTEAEGWGVIEDDTPVTFDVQPFKLPSLWHTEIESWRYPSNFFTADSGQDIAQRLHMIESELGLANSPLWAVLAEQPGYAEWVIRQESK